MPDHSHCKFCGDPIPFGEEYCNDGCRRGEANRQAAEKRKEWMFYGSAIVVIVAIVIVGYLL